MASKSGNFTSKSKYYEGSEAFNNKAAAAAMFPSMQTAGIKRRRRMHNMLQSDDVFVITPYRSLSATANSVDSSREASSNVSMADKKLLTSWGFPPKIIDFYHRKGIREFFDWQVDCLDRPGVLDGRNLVYSAPTSAGKTMVSDVLLYKTLLERKKKAIIILPYVSITVEKVQSLKQLFRRIGIRIESFAGNSNPRGGIQRVDVAVCTIEKANNMLNRLIEEGQLSEIGIVIVDELHMLGDSSRGYLLELLLSKLLYVSKQQAGTNKDTVLQIVGMSATIPNLPDISQWLDAELYITNFRPVPLYQRVVRGTEVLQLNEDMPRDENALLPLTTLELADLSIKQKDEAPLIFSAIETLIEGYSALVFCPTKAGCEKYSRAIAENIFEFGSNRKEPISERIREIGKTLIKSLDAAKITSLIQSLKRTSSGIDRNLETVVRFGVAFHHAGLSIEERSIIEKAFRDGTVRILCSTTTLSAGVNLPARRVLISSPFDYKGALLDVTCFRQMVGRAGRKGIDELGEAMLFCKPADYARVLRSLLLADLSPIKSCLLSYRSQSPPPRSGASPDEPVEIQMSDSLKRAILEVISNGTATHYADICRYVECTFFKASYSSWASDATESPNLSTAINQVFHYLTSNELIYLSNGGGLKDDSKLVISPLGKAIVASGVAPDDGKFIMKELDKARRSLFLVNDLHLIYEITPIYVAEQLETIKWDHYLNKIYYKLDEDCKAVAKLVGVKENYFWTKISTFQMEPRRGTPAHETLLIYKRFYASLALFDLVQEVPLIQVASKYQLSKGLVQSLQQQAATFAGMLSTFCGKLGWGNMELLIEQFQPRLCFGIQRELIDLMRLSFLTSALARQLFQKGYETLVSLIYRKESDIEEALIATSVFESKTAAAAAVVAKEQPVTAESCDPALTTVFIPNLDQHMTIRELARLIRKEARILVEADIGQKLNFDDVDSVPSNDQSPSSSLSSPTEQSPSPGPTTTSSAVTAKSPILQQPNVLSKDRKAVPSAYEETKATPSPASTAELSLIKQSVGGSSESPFAPTKTSNLSSANADYLRTSTPNQKTRPGGATSSKANLTGTFAPAAANSADIDLEMLTDDISMTDVLPATVKEQAGPGEQNPKEQQSASVKKDRSCSLMSLGESLDDISWSKLVDEPAKAKYGGNDENISPGLSQIGETPKTFDDAKEYEPCLLEEESDKEVERIVASATEKVIKRTRSGSPILFHSDDSCMSSESEPNQKVAASTEAVPVKSNLKRPLSANNSQGDFSADDLSDLTCEEIDQLCAASNLVQESTRARAPLATHSTTALSDLSKDTDAGDDDIEFFQTFRRRHLQQSELPPSFDVALTTKVPAEKFQLILVRSERHCKQMLEEIFASHVLLDADAVLDVAVHFTLEPIVNPFFTKLKKKSLKGAAGKSTAELEPLRIEDRYPMELSELYLARLGHSRIFLLNNRPMFEYFKSQLAAWLTRLDPFFDQECTSASSSPLTSSSNTSSSTESGPRARFRFLTYDIKKALYIFQYGFQLSAHSLMHRIDWHDVSVAIWLLDPESKSFDIRRLSLQDMLQLALHFQLTQVDYLQKAQNIAKLNQALQLQSGQVASENLHKTALLFHFTSQFCHRLLDNNLYLAYKLIELPCRLCLYTMETQGIQVDHQQLSVEQNRLSRYLENLESRIFQLAGGEFNLNSPEHVARVLYQEQNLLSNLFDVKSSSRSKKSISAPGRRLPKSLSTSKLALVKLQEACGTSTNLPTLIMEWRRVNHAFHQTIVPIRNALRFERPARDRPSSDTDSSSAFIFCQCDEWSVTGRISMHEPNLINVDKNFELSTISIAMARQLEQMDSQDGHSSPPSSALSPTNSAASKPVTIELRQNIRAREGYVLVSADYAQLELRILAHFTKDPALLRTLNDPNNDVFKSIAASWKGISTEQVDYEMRQQAKQICYGIIYGIGDKSLAENLAVTEKEAAEFRDSFLQRYNKIKSFEERIHDQCAVNGYVDTISHRRRPIPNIFSDNQALQAKGRRQAVNTMIQGSAADIIKLSMVAVDKAIRRRAVDASLLLQMHDELMYEVRNEANKPAEFARLLKTQMEKVSRHLDVILPVKVRTGPNWGQLHEVHWPLGD